MRLSTKVEIDYLQSLIFVLSLLTRFWCLEKPRHVVFDEIVFGKHVSMYVKRQFYFESNPPFPTMLVALSAVFGGYNGEFDYDTIGQVLKIDWIFWQALMGISAGLAIGLILIHLMILNKSGPHDHKMSLAFQSTLLDGVIKFDKGQPTKIAYGSQITLRNSENNCWLHSHKDRYPIKYSDSRGSSHQQQITCYEFQDVNNWWIVKKPGSSSLFAKNKLEILKNGDPFQLVHLFTGKFLNSHNVAGPVTPTNQEVSGYIDYNISMPAYNIWNLESSNFNWEAITSTSRLIHNKTNTFLRITGQRLPDWGFRQLEVTTVKNRMESYISWNVENHIYNFEPEGFSGNQYDYLKSQLRNPNLQTKSDRSQSGKVSLWQKYIELQTKMIFPEDKKMIEHRYTSYPLYWMFCERNIPYWYDSGSKIGKYLTRMSKRAQRKRKVSVKDEPEVIKKVVTSENLSSEEEEETSGILKIMKAPFYDIDCKELSRALLGKILVKKIDCNRHLEGKIVETEAYIGGPDKASHSYNGKKTPRTEAMFMKPGTAYVYNIYGAYCCFNISSKGEGAAVLIRAIEPLQGLDEMRQNRKNHKKASAKLLKPKEICNGPSKLTLALNITKDNTNKLNLSDPDGDIYIIDDDESKFDIVVCPRIGLKNIEKEWADKPYRYYIKDNPFVSIRNKECEKLIEKSN
ncbi:DgyrCDS1767 [Dimorphilus gyrociliatus]|uniref:DNA-3-methyladenine glycosylase n=1 Tax=Dimorphilus gyrociliatus TaxID=2664684 RepID=A0A7I8VDF8_9ANNE|nr:DgyrCDS1767 [Dimorphilus gyrociliatus]